MKKIRAEFYCTIYDSNGDIAEEDFVFDEREFDSIQELDEYCRHECYAEGEPCGMWGLDQGIYTGVRYELEQEQDGPER